MLTLLTFPPSFDTPSHSPFCTKAIALLHLSGEAWQPKYLTNPTKMPLGRLPVLRTQDGQTIPDSAHIQAYLEIRGHDFNQGLSQQDRAYSHALIRMSEQHLTAGMAHERWLRNDCWPTVRSAFFGELPAVLRQPIATMMRAKVRRGLTSHGIAQFSEEDRLTRLGKDLSAIEATLNGKPFLFADHPTAADAAIAPVLDMIRNLPCDTGLRRLVHENVALLAYVHRARAALYPQ